MSDSPLPHPLARRDVVPDLDQRGFVKVTCPACKAPDVWLRCQGCQKADHFLLEEAGPSCSCGANYTFGTCTCGATVPRDGLAFLAFDDGPRALADMEIAWGRVIAVLCTAGGAVGLLVWWLAQP